MTFIPYFSLCLNSHHNVCIRLCLC